MITQKDIDKLLENPASWQQYLIIGQNVKPIKTLARDIVKQLDVDFTMLHEFDTQPYEMRCGLTMFGKCFFFECAPYSHSENPLPEYWNLTLFIKTPNEEGRACVTIREQREEITERMYKNEIAKFITNYTNKYYK